MPILLRALLCCIAFSVTTLAVQALPSSADAVSPLAVGSAAPGATVKALEGGEVDLRALLQKQPTILIFYRGGWCPFCNTQLAGLQSALPEFSALGYQLIAISPDKPEALSASVQKQELGYRLYSDRQMAAAEAYGVAFRVDPKTQEAYAKRNFDLAPIPGEPDARWLPVPSVFVIGRDGTVRFVFSNPNYKVRPPVEQLLAAARAAAE